MKVIFTRQLIKDIRKIGDRSLAVRLEEVIMNLKVANTLPEIAGIKKLAGYRNMFRIRIGEYRLGIYVDNEVVELCRFLHRKDIYRYFP